MLSSYGLHAEHTSQLFTIAADPDSLSSVKLEPDDDGFIQDQSHQFGSSPPPPFEHLIPPTEVPLRATQASKEMRRLMSVFRLNPFSMHHAGGRGVSAPMWNGEDAGPLTEEPRYIDFQLDGFPDSEGDLESEDGSSGPLHEVPSLESDESAASPWIGSEVSLQSSWQAPDWSISGPYYSPSETSVSLELEYPNSTHFRSALSYRETQSYYGFESHHSQNGYKSFMPAPGSYNTDSSECSSPIDAYPCPPPSGSSPSTPSLAPSTHRSSHQWHAPLGAVTLAPGYADYDRDTGPTAHRKESRSHPGHEPDYSTHVQPSALPASAVISQRVYSRSGGLDLGSYGYTAASSALASKQWLVQQTAHSEAYPF